MWFLHLALKLVLWYLGFFAVAVAILGVITFTFAFVLAPTIFFPRKPQTAPFTGQRPPRGLWKAILRELWAGYLIYASYIFWPLITGYNRHRYANQRPLILLHGYGVSSSSWFWFMRMLARRGVHQPQYALEYNWLKPLQDDSRRLAATIERALREQHADQVDIVCHSWGGFLSRWYIEQMGLSAKVRRLIMLSTPNQGTWSTTYGVGAPRKQMSIGSPTVLLFNQAPSTPPYATLWTDCDEIVVPAAFSLIADIDGNPTFTRQFIELGHLGMLMSGAVATQVASLLLSSPWPGPVT